MGQHFIKGSWWLKGNNRIWVHPHTVDKNQTNNQVKQTIRINKSPFTTIFSPPCHQSSDMIVQFLLYSGCFCFSGNLYNSMIITLHGNLVTEHFSLVCGCRDNLFYSKFHHDYFKIRVTEITAEYKNKSWSQQLNKNMKKVLDITVYTNDNIHENGLRRHFCDNTESNVHLCSSRWTSLLHF